MGAFFSGAGRRHSRFCRCAGRTSGICTRTGALTLLPRVIQTASIALLSAARARLPRLTGLKTRSIYSLAYRWSPGPRSSSVLEVIAACRRLRPRIARAKSGSPEA